MEREAVIEVKDLDVMRSGTLVIQGASFEIAKGDYVGIVGPNGGGKTTLLLAMLGMIPRNRGTVKIFGQDLERFSDWGKIAYVSQDAINFDSDFPLTVRELVSLGRLGPKKVGRPLRRADWSRVDEALGFMGIFDLSGKRIGELSGGQKQRMFVAMALVRDPEVIILDEPVAGIDAVTQEKFYQKMSDLNQRKGITILMVSHDLTAVFCRMSKLICVNREVNVAEITPDVDPNEILRKAYGEHFHFVFHRHECRGEFRND
ncbi:MAG: metal ABC transporter ATP-binding protein [Candidatus Methanosuratincola sp.]